MRHALGILLVVAVTSAACGLGDGQVDPERREVDIGVVMALSLVQLVTVDNTFGPDHRFSQVLVLSSTDPQAGDPLGEGAGRTLSQAERRAIEDALSDGGTIRPVCLSSTTL